MQGQTQALDTFMGHTFIFRTTEGNLLARKVRPTPRMLNVPWGSSILQSRKKGLSMDVDGHSPLAPPATDPPLMRVVQVITSRKNLLMSDLVQKECGEDEDDCEKSDTETLQRTQHVSYQYPHMTSP